MNKTCVFSALCALGTLLGFAQQQVEVQELEEVVLTDSRFALKKEHSGKTVIKITKEDLERSSGQTIAQIISTKSGITMNGNLSNAGTPLSAFVRGGQNRQVLVLIDGVAISDPSQIENNFDLQLLAPDQIESIEILKGASSALYGNRASTAVINIKLKQASKKSVSAYVSSYFATNNNSEESAVDIADFTNAVGVNGTLDAFNYTVNFSNKYTDGLSAIRAPEGEAPFASDPFSKINGHARVGYKITDNFKVSAFGSLDKYKTAYDESFGFLDADNMAYTEQYRAGISPEFNYGKGSVHVNLGYNTINREFDSSFPAKFEARSLVIDAFNRYKINDKLYTIVGLNYVKTDMDSFLVPFGSNDFEADLVSDTANDHIIDPYINLTYLSDFGFNINAGARLNNHSEYGGHFVYNVNPSYVVKRNGHIFKILASYSTAYVTPSLYQLFAPGFGNADLQPQEDRTIEAGLSWDLGKKAALSALYFNRDQDKYIDYVVTNFDTFEGEYQNLPEDFNVQGVEVEASFKPTKSVNVITNYTFTERKDGVLFRVPKHKVNAQLDYNISSKTFASVSYQYNSERTSPFLTDDFTANRILDSFSLVNLNASHMLMKDRLKLYVGIQNVFNEDYEELYRFSTLGRNYRIGFSLNF